MTFDPLGISFVPLLMGVIADSFGIGVAMKSLIVPMLGVILTLLVPGLEGEVNRGLRGDTEV